MPEPDKSAEREKRKEALRQRLAEQAAVPEQFIVGGGHKLLPLCFVLTGAALVYTVREIGKDWYVNGGMPPLTNYLFPIGITLFGAVLSIALLIVTVCIRSSACRGNRSITAKNGTPVSRSGRSGSRA